ncbi:MAG: hypothetical protein EOP87_13035 [Verrucomicrobiaceae bacterium]|nr:MAG: hypothetical protein EOP87_13035 [Verrucomicrobiaceae bacterium]
MTLPHSDDSEVTEDEFRRANERSIASLRKMHPDRTDEDLTHALWQASTIYEAAGNARLIHAALILLD